MFSTVPSQICSVLSQMSCTRYLNAHQLYLTSQRIQALDILVSEPAGCTVRSIGSSDVNHQAEHCEGRDKWNQEIKSKWNGLQIECNGGRNLNINLQRCCCCASRSTPVVLSIVTRSQPTNMHSNIQSKVFLSCSYWGICRYHVIKVMLMFTATTLAEFWWHQYKGNLKIYIRLMYATVLPTLSVHYCWW